VATKWSVSGQPPEKAAEIARWAVGQGFKKMKVKVGIEPESDVARVRAVREAVGPSMKLGIDANGGWPNSDVAIATIERMKAFDIYFAEQPAPPGDIDGMADVRRAVGLPIVADESLYSLTDARSLHRRGACDAFSIYIGKAGGIGAARSIAAFAQSVGIKCIIGSNLELGVATAAMIHFGLATKALDPELYPCDIIGPFFYDDDVVREPLLLAPGVARATDAPGLGVELDESKVERYRVR
jgi:muconate cycloisomerase